MDADTISELKLYEHLDFSAPASNPNKKYGKLKQGSLQNEKAHNPKTERQKGKRKITPNSKPTPKLSKQLSRVKYKLDANELLFFPKHYDPMPLRSTTMLPNDSIRKRNYIQQINGKYPDEIRTFRAKQDARYQKNKKCNKTNESSVQNDDYDDDELLCLEHLVGRCNRQCGKWHQMRNVRLLGVCKFYLSGVCMHGDSCQFMHDEFPCRYYYLNMPHPQSVDGDNCRFKHGGPLPSRLRQYFRKQIEIWVKDMTKEKPDQFESVVLNFMDKFDKKQFQLEQEYEVKNIEASSTSSPNKRSLLDNILTTTQIKALAERNIKDAVQINQIPVDDLLNYGLTMDQIYEITIATHDECSQTSTSQTSHDSLTADNLSNDQIILNNSISSLETIDNPFQGFSEVELKDAIGILQTNQLVIQMNTETPSNDSKGLESECDRIETNSLGSSKEDCSDDSDEEYNLIINEEV